MAVFQVKGGALVAGVGWVTTKKWMSLRVKGVEMVSVLLEYYSLGRRRKNNATQATSAIAWYLGEPPWATESMQRRMDMGRVRTLLGRGSSFA